MSSWMGVRECEWDAGYQLTYFADQPVPYLCVAHERNLEKERAEKEANEEAERRRKEAEEAERSRRAAEELLRESPVQSEERLKRDLELVGTLTPAQQEATRDAGNHVVLTDSEERSLRSISLDQWHALSQLTAFYKWLNDKSKEAQAQAERQQEQAEKQQEQAEREQERARLAIYQSLMADAAARQAAAAEWQAASLWWQQRCLRNLTAGLQCY
jgi:hypothetical protein